MAHNWWMRAFYGAMGGVCALAAKYVGQDHEVVGAALLAGDDATVTAKLLGYAILGPVLILLGAIVAGASNEETRAFQLLLVGLSAPGLVTTLSGTGAGPAGQPLPVVQERAAMPEPPGDFAWLVPTAHAGQMRLAAGDSLIKRSIQGFFNVRETRYWVVAGAFPDRRNAQIFA